MSYITKIRHHALPFLAGILMPLGFAPFHFPGLSILSLAFFYALLKQKNIKEACSVGFFYGLGFFGVGVSWVYISIHDYGHLNSLLSGIITLFFVMYLALFPMLTAGFFKICSKNTTVWISCLLFSALWCFAEYLRATLLTGFPWLLLGTGQIDTPMKYLLPIVGIYGVGFLACLSATCLVHAMRASRLKQGYGILAFLCLILSPSLLKHTTWINTSNTPLSVGIIQSNLSMRDKWDESLFWTLIHQYQESFEKLTGKTQLIVMPESAIPLPESYVAELIENIDLRAKNTNSSVLLGIPQPTDSSDSHFYNSVLALGQAQGHYLKQHLVPFGEFVPDKLERLMQLLGIPVPYIKPGREAQSLILVDNHPIASLICYELAYPEILRRQLPEAEWIVSISDDGWFGHSLAMYQQLQMAQVLSLETGRYQVVSNNDGLSSVIDTQGNINASLKAFSKSTLEANIYPATGATPWVLYGDSPVLYFCLIIIFLATFGNHLALNLAAKPMRVR